MFLGDQLIQMKKHRPSHAGVYEQDTKLGVFIQLIALINVLCNADVTDQLLKRVEGLDMLVTSAQQSPLTNTIYDLMEEFASSSNMVRRPELSPPGDPCDSKEDAECNDERDLIVQKAIIRLVVS